MHYLADSVIDMLPRIVFPNNRNVAGTDDFQKTLIFVAVRFGDNKGDFHVLLERHPFGKSVTCSAQTA